MIKTNFAQELFQVHRKELADRIDAQKIRLSENGEYDKMLLQSSRELKAWEQSSGRKQVYTSEELTYARLVKDNANKYQQENALALYRTDAEHQARIAHEILNNGLAEKMMKEGNEDKKLGIVELSARLMPVLTFTGSSSYFEIGIIPYGKKSREVLGEETVSSFVSEYAALESARNLSRKFNVHYSLAETSAAPRDYVPKSGKKPEIFICGIVGGDVIIQEGYTIDTQFRSEFNSIVRELMYQSLRRIYGES